MTHFPDRNNLETNILEFGPNKNRRFNINCSLNKPSPRKELLHGIHSLLKTAGQKLYPDSFDNRIRAAIRVGDMKLLTGKHGKHGRTY